MPQDHSIPLQTAIDMTTRYRNEKDNIVKPEYSNLLPVYETFDKTAFETLTQEPGCLSIRGYLGMDQDMTVRLIFVGVDENDRDILPGNQGQGGQIMEQGNHCPPICAPAGPLNS